MSEWDALRLGNLVSIRKGKLARLSLNPKDGFLPYLGAGALEGRIEAFAETSGAELATDKDVLMLWDGERSGLVGKGYEGVVASTVARLTPKDGVDPAFLFHALGHKFEWIQARRTGTGVPHVPKDLCDILIVPIPKSAGEQRAIAAILDAADEAIAKTEALIAKLRAIKQGLLHDLLTRGLDHNGELRDPEKHPEQFKRTPLGLLPLGWSIEPLGRAAGKVQDGTHFSPKSKTGPFRYMTSRNIRFGTIDLTECGWISEEEHRSIYSRCDVRPGDVLLTKDGANTGNAAIYDLPEEVSLLSSVAFVRCDNRKIVSKYLLQYLLSPMGQRRIKDLMSGVAITRLTVAKIRDFTVPLPEPDEQVEISTRLDMVDCDILAEETYLSKLKAIKKGLMQDLLTGRVRVPADMIATTATG